MKKYMTIIHAKNQTSILNSAELPYIKTAVKMRLLNYSINYQTQYREQKDHRNLKEDYNIS
jgi:hypothetical protein